MDDWNAPATTATGFYLRSVNMYIQILYKSENFITDTRFVEVI